MSWTNDLKRIKKEKDAADAQRKREQIEEKQRKRRAFAKLNPMVRRLLDKLGMAQWGRGFIRKRYRVDHYFVAGVWHVTRFLPKKPAYSRPFERYEVYLRFDCHGNASHFEVRGKGCAETEDTSEGALQEAWKHCFESGPFEDAIDDSPIGLYPK